jgi:gas vesicle protein
MHIEQAENGRNNSYKGFILGVLAGGITGSVIALLYAPRSGKELRREIHIRKEKALSGVNKTLADARHKTSDLLSDGRDKARDFFDNAKKTIKGAKQNTEEILDSGKEYLSGKAETLKDAFNEGLEAFSKERKSNRQ